MKFREKFLLLMAREGTNPNALGAERVKGLSQSKLNAWAKEDRIPKISDLALLAKRFCVPVAYLVDDDIDDPLKAIGATLTPEEIRVIEMARQIGVDRAGHVLEMVMINGYLPSMRRLSGYIVLEPPQSDENPGNELVHIAVGQEDVGVDGPHPNHDSARRKPRKPGQ